MHSMPQNNYLCLLCGRLAISLLLISHDTCYVAGTAHKFFFYLLLHSNGRSIPPKPKKQNKKKTALPFTQKARPEMEEVMSVKPRATWLLSYDASNPPITHTLILEHTPLHIDECHSTQLKDTKYTILHLEKPVAQKRMHKAMTYLSSQSGISQICCKAIVVGKSPAHPDAPGVLYYSIIHSFHEHKDTSQIWISPKKQYRTILGDFNMALFQPNQLPKTSTRSIIEVDTTEDLEDYDVLKKQRKINESSVFAGADVTSAVLGSEEAAEYFHSFSSEVMCSQR